MRSEETQRGAAALESLLERERDALLAGDLERVTTLLPEKQSLMERLADVPAQDAVLLRSVSDKVQRNQKLLTGAMEGVRTVTERLAALRRVRDTLETYGADGKRRNIDTDRPPSVERRA